MNGPRGPRPRGIRFAGPVLLAVLGLVVLLSAFGYFRASMTHTDDTIPRDNQPYRITLEGTEERMLWTETHIGDLCTVTDTETGEPIEVREPEGDFDREIDGTYGSGIGTFDPESTAVTVSCAEADGSVEVGRAPSRDMVTASLAGAFGGIGLGVLGLIWLVVLLIVDFTRGRRTA